MRPALVFLSSSNRHPHALSIHLEFASPSLPVFCGCIRIHKDFVRPHLCMFPFPAVLTSKAPRLRRLDKSESVWGT